MLRALKQEELEHSYPQVLHLEEYTCYKASKQAEEMYWNSGRIKKVLDDWSIYAYYENGQMLGALYCLNEGLMLEIFGIGTYVCYSKRI